MMEITIPGYGPCALTDLVLDFNGTLACDGTMIEGITPLLKIVSEKFRIHVLTADTFGDAATELSGTPCNLVIISPDDQDGAKLRYIEKLGPETTVCIGNGRNDRLMLKKAALGIAVIQGEGAATETIAAADIVTTSILDALNLLSHPLRLVATLRS
jgi:soluble P-type ATPase